MPSRAGTEEISTTRSDYSTLRESARGKDRPKKKGWGKVKAVLTMIIAKELHRALGSLCQVSQRPKPIPPSEEGKLPASEPPINMERSMLLMLSALPVAASIALAATASIFLSTDHQDGGVTSIIRRLLGIQLSLSEE